MNVISIMEDVLISAIVPMDHIHALATVDTH